VLVDYKCEAEHVPLAVLGRGQAPFRIYDSLLSEYAALGFDYGYSVSHPDTLVLWEAQFGDFVNGGQIIMDQFIVAAEDKWAQESGLVLLLPHGFEGQGPEHSSARLERFLTSCAEDNMRVAYPTTAAQYFHLLRAQALARPRKPLVVMTPKKYLRMPASRSAVSELTDGRFQPVLLDREAPPTETVRRVVLCSGKFGHELIERRNKENAPVAVLRLEQLYPFPGAELLRALEDYPERELVWAQEEPENMGAWQFVDNHLRRVLGGDAGIGHVAREESGSPASGRAAHGSAHRADLTGELHLPPPRRTGSDSFSAPLGARRASQPILPMARPKPMEITARMPWTTLKPTESSCPDMMTMRLIQT
jgi:2-oxoglutarate dehydrogenase E1 component